jgi:hypothetical protein
LRDLLARIVDHPGKKCAYARMVLLPQYVGFIFQAGLADHKINQTLYPITAQLPSEIATSGARLCRSRTEIRFC